MRNKLRVIVEQEFTLKRLLSMNDRIQIRVLMTLRQSRKFSLFSTNSHILPTHSYPTHTPKKLLSDPHSGAEGGCKAPISWMTTAIKQERRRKSISYTNSQACFPGM